MPELPEVRHYSQKLKKFVNYNLININILNGPYKTNATKKYSVFRNDIEKYKVCKLISVDTKGKFMYWTLKNKDNQNNNVKYLGIHHGMEGSWTFDEKNKTKFDRIHFSKS